MNQYVQSRNTHKQNKRNVQRFTTLFHKILTQFYNENIYAFNFSSNIIINNIIIKNFRDYLLFMNEFILFNNVSINIRIDDYIIIKFFDVEKSAK